MTYLQHIKDEQMRIAQQINRAEFKRFYSQIISLLILPLIALFFLGCTRAVIRGAKNEEEKLADGVYEGSYRHGPNSAKVRVIISHLSTNHLNHSYPIQTKNGIPPLRQWNFALEIDPPRLSIAPESDGGKGLRKRRNCFPLQDRLHI